MARPIICMSLLEKTDNFVVYEYGEKMESLDGKIKLSLQRPRQEYEIIKESAMGNSNTLLAHSKLARIIEEGKIPEKVSRAS